MRGNSHVRFLGEGQPVMAVPYPTASLSHRSMEALIAER